MQRNFSKLPVFAFVGAIGLFDGFVFVLALGSFDDDIVLGLLLVAFTGNEREAEGKKERGYK